MSPVPLRFFPFAALLLAASSVTCLVPDTNHCAHRSDDLRGHDWCAQQHPDRPFCSRCVSARADEHSGCVDQEPDPACLVGSVPQGGDTGSSTDSASDDSTSTTAAEGCECASIDPSRPACNEQGDCVRCTRTDPGVCSGPTPVCDEDTQECMPCSLHSQCLDAVGSACHLETGECLPPDRVWHVQGGAAAGGDGTDAAPLRTIGEAMANIPPAGQGTIVLHEAKNDAGTTVAYDDVVTISGDRLVAIVAPGGERPRIVFDTQSALVTIVDDGTIAYLDGLSLQSNSDGPGLRVERGKVYADRCEVTKNLSGIEVVDGGELVLRNGIVTAARDDQRVLYVEEGTATLVYSTIVHTSPDFSSQDPHALLCSGSMVTVAMRNSIAISVDGSSIGWECPGAEVSRSAVDGTLPGVIEDDNIHLCSILNCGSDDTIPSLFAEGDLTTLRLSPFGATILASDPDDPMLVEGDPPFDIDLNPRTTERDFIGAHAPAPRR